MTGFCASGLNRYFCSSDSTDSMFWIEHRAQPCQCIRSGGAWTERKLSVVRRYLEIYTQALKNQAFQRAYIDAFAGTGDRTEKQRKTLLLIDLPEFEAEL